MAGHVVMVFYVLLIITCISVNTYTHTHRFNELVCIVLMQTQVNLG